MHPSLANRFRNALPFFARHPGLKRGNRDDGVSIRGRFRRSPVLALLGSMLLGLLVPPLAAETLYNGIELPKPWPPRGRELTRQPLATPPYLQSPPPTIPIDTGRQLLVDDFLVEQTDLRRTYHRPKCHPASPVIAPDRPWEDGRSGVFSEWGVVRSRRRPFQGVVLEQGGNVLRDEQGWHPLAKAESRGGAGNQHSGSRPSSISAQLVHHVARSLRAGSRTTVQDVHRRD